MLYHVQNFVAITLLESKWGQKTIFNQIWIAMENS